MELSVIERLLLLDSLPPQGDATTLKIVRTMRESLSFSEEEHAKLNFRQEDGMTQWDNNALVKDVEFGPKAMALVVDMLEEKSKAKELTAQTLGLYERFVEGTTE